jgi:hypothetical protein
MTHYQMSPVLDYVDFGRRYICPPGEVVSTVDNDIRLGGQGHGKLKVLKACWGV